MQCEFRHIIFDLDDTLLDTSGTLIPRATILAVEAMAREGLTLHPSESVRVREDILRELPRALVFRELAERYAPLSQALNEPRVERVQRLEKTGLDVFLNPPVGILKELKGSALVSGALELLDYFRARNSSLHLVTAGIEDTQIQKLQALGLEAFFQSVQVVEPERGSKRKAYENLNLSGALARSVLVVGNRVDTDLAPGKQLGFRTAWIRHGEHKAVEPQSPEEIPDFEVPTPGDLLKLFSQLDAVGKAP